MLRWLLPILTVVALIGQSVTAFAAAGVFGDAGCCCPVKAKCKCHDHDGKSSPTMKRCAGDVKLIAPAIAAAVPGMAIEIVDEPRVTSAPAVSPLPVPDDLSRTPEKPPF